MGAADNNFGATATAPVELLQQYWGATYTTPQTSENRVGYVNLTGKVEATPTWTHRRLRPCARFRSEDSWMPIRPALSHARADPTLLCFGTAARQQMA